MHEMTYIGPVFIDIADINKHVVVVMTSNQQFKVKCIDGRHGLIRCHELLPFEVG